MKSLLKHIIPLFAVLVFASCRNDEAKVIPRAKMAEIYAEMLMTDQWITNTPGMRMIADTSLVYEPILEEYGYDHLDYLKSVDYYMNDPERFSRILRTSGELLDKRLADLKEKKRLLELEQENLKKLLMYQNDYSLEEYFPYLADEPYVHYYDSLTFELDSCRVYKLIPIETADTLYDRIEMIIRVDSLAVVDSLTVSDTLAVKDSIHVKEPVDEQVKEPVKEPVKGRMRPDVPKKSIPRIPDTTSMRVATDMKKK
jgi:hypothetical protein